MNLSLCFPDLDEQALDALTKESFKHFGISLIETTLVWFHSPARFESAVTIHGLERLLAAEQAGRGVLLVGMHQSTLDFCGAMLGRELPIDVLYRRNENRLLEALMTLGRGKYFPHTIERGEVRQVIRRLKAGAVIWYAADQDYGSKVSVFAPFFGVDCATTTATSRFAKICDGPTLFLSFYRNLAAGRYDIHVSAPLENFPGDDPVADATLVNQYVQAAVEKAPEQYWWLHRRFKTRPAGQAVLY